ncbi:MAG: RHS repeat-associated core domain-containing protein, partial [Acidobacteriota bacterium]
GTFYPTGDHLGSARVVTDQSRVVKSRHDYLPFGEELTASFGRAGIPGYGNHPLRQKFTGKERDSESNLDYFGARYFSGAQGRFTSTDLPFADQHPEDPQTWNLYSYVTNNPLKHIDPTGRGKVSVFFRVITKIVEKDGQKVVYKKVTKDCLTRDEARRLFRKQGGDVFGSRKGSKNVAGKGAIEEPVQGKAGDNLPHFHDADRLGGHAFYGVTGVAIPGATLGVDTFGDNVLGQAIDFLNPLSDVQFIVDTIQDGIDAAAEAIIQGIQDQMGRGAQAPCPECQVAPAQPQEPQQPSSPPPLPKKPCKEGETGSNCEG